jgi:hypothetical protein
MYFKFPFCSDFERWAGGRGGGVEAMVALIQENEGITDLDISNCRLGPNICKDLAKAIKENVTLRYILLDGNPFGDGAGVCARVLMCLLPMLVFRHGVLHLHFDSINILFILNIRLAVSVSDCFCVDCVCVCVCVCVLVFEKHRFKIWRIY